MSKMSEMNIRAIVSHSPQNNGEARFSMENVVLRKTQRNEVLVEMVATGICGTDLFFAKSEEGVLGPFPRVLGHEGVGWVRAVGEDVKAVSVGDAVSLSFSSCKECSSCTNRHPAYCNNFSAVNYGAAVAYQGLDGQDIAGYFFGQSSFASYSNVPETCVVNISQWVTNEHDLHVYAALGCSLQSGSATVSKLVNAGRDDSVVVMGVGAVGLSAIMAAKICGCSPIIAVDRHSSRLEKSKEFGTTHVIDTSIESIDVSTEVRKITNGNGSTITIDATGVVSLIKTGFEFTANKGKMILLGVPPLNADLNIGNLVQFMESGKSILGSMVGDAIPQEHIPQMLEWYKSGAFPIDRLVTTYKTEEFSAAIDDMKSGRVIKPVLLWK